VGYVIRNFDMWGSVARVQNPNVSLSTVTRLVGMMAHRDSVSVL
jgi:hypothetical protein